MIYSVKFAPTQLSKCGMSQEYSVLKDFQSKLYYNFHIFARNTQCLTALHNRAHSMETGCCLQIPHCVCRVSRVVSGLSAIWSGIYTRRHQFCLGASSAKSIMTLLTDTQTAEYSSCFHDIQLGELVPGLVSPSSVFLPSLSDIVILYTNSVFTIEHR